MKKIRLSFILSLCLMAFSSCTIENRIKAKTPEEIDPNEYVQTVETFQITFLNGDGTKMYNAKMNKGESLTKISNSLVPTQSSDGDNDYVFKNWDPEPKLVEKDTIFRPVFEAKPHEEFTFSYSSTKGGYILTSYNLQSPETVSIPSSYGSLNSPVVEIGDNAFANKSNLKTVFLGENIKTIGKGAFRNCTSLTKVAYPAEPELTTIDEEAFANCRKLKMFLPNNVQENTEITLPDSVTTINAQAFRGCAEIDNITLGKNVGFVGEHIFQNCSAILSMTVDPENTKFSSEESNIILNITTNQIIAGCKTSVFTSNKIKSIADEVFNGIHLVSPSPLDPSVYIEVTELVLPATVVSIGQYAFANNTSLVSVTLKGAITKIYQSSFENCSNITTFVIEGQSEDFFTYSNCIIRKKISDGSTLPSESLTLPYLLYGTKGMRELHSDITGIGPRAFYGSGITNVIFNTTTETNKITYIGDEVFRECTNLVTLKMYFPTLLATNRSIIMPANLCRGCTSLTEIIIPSSFYTMSIGGDDTKGNGSFYDCHSLHSVYIHSNLQHIFENTFTNCSSLANLYYSGTQPGFNDRMNNGSYKTKGNEKLYACPNKSYGVTAPFAIPETQNNNT